MACKIYSRHKLQLWVNENIPFFLNIDNDFTFADKDYISLLRNIGRYTLYPIMKFLIWRWTYSNVSDDLMPPVKPCAPYIGYVDNNPVICSRVRLLPLYDSSTQASSITKFRFAQICVHDKWMPSNHSHPLPPFSSFSSPANTGIFRDVLPVSVKVLAFSVCTVSFHSEYPG